MNESLISSIKQQQNHLGLKNQKSLNLTPTRLK